MRLLLQIILLLAASSFPALARAKLEPPDGRILHGAGQTRAGFESYWNLMPAENKPLIYLIYTNLDTGLTQLKKDLDYFSYNYPDCIPVIGVSWVWDLHPENHQDVDIAAGKKDEGIRRLIGVIKAQGKPVFICPGYEFNGRRWNGYEPKTYQEAWKRMVGMFRQEEVVNASFVWTASAMGDSDFMNFYPGDDWTDWWGINALEEKALNKPWVQSYLKEAGLRKKPVMVCEASAIFAGTKGGQVSWNRWFKPFFAAIEAHPQIKGFAYINDDWSAPDAALPQLASWGDCRIQLNAFVSDAYKKEMAKEKYIHAAPIDRISGLLFGAVAPKEQAALRDKNLPLFELADPGTEAVVDYEKYGEFQNVGGFGYRYIIKDREGLAKASGEGIDPNRNVSKNPRFEAVKRAGKIRKNVWENRPHLTGDPEGDYFAWATSGEDFGVRLLNTGIALEEAGHYQHALKAYRAAMILYPKSYGWSSAKKRWTWLVASVAWGRILNLTQRHPELNLKLVDANVSTRVKIDGDWTKNQVAITPGRFVAAKSEERSGRGIAEKRGGKVAAVRFESGDWEFQVDGKPYVIKGVTYTPTRAGKHLNDWNWMTADENGNGLIDAPQESWVDANRNGKQDADEPAVGDFQLLQDMGCNTIRWIHEHPLNLPLLRKMHEKHGIRVALCEPLGAYVIHSGATWEEGTDYKNPEHRKNMLKAVRDLVEQVKDEPWLLCYILGNENNMPTDSSGMVNAARTNAFAEPEAYAKFLNEAAELIHQLDPDHPVGVGNQGWGLIEHYAKHAPALDFIGVNEYIGWHGFGSLFAHVKVAFDRPVLVTEYGCDAYWTGKGADEEWQARYHRGCWEDIEMNLAGAVGQGNCIGGVAFEFLDEWWKDNSVAELVDGKLVDVKIAIQSSEPTIEMAFPDDWSQEEWFGIVGQGNGRSSPFLRVPRKSYYLYQELWKKAAPGVQDHARHAR